MTIYRELKRAGITKRSVRRAASRLRPLDPRRASVRIQFVKKLIIEEMSQ